MDTPDTELKKWFEENYLDGDKVQVGQMLSSSECLDALSSRDTYWKERVRKEVEGLQERFGDWDNGDENEPLLLKCEVLGILDNLK